MKTAWGKNSEFPNDRRRHLSVLVLLVSFLAICFAPRTTLADHWVYLDYIVNQQFPLGSFRTRYEHADVPLSVDDPVALKNALAEVLADYAVADLPDDQLDLANKYTYVTFAYDAEQLRVVVEVSPKHLKRTEITHGERTLAGPAEGNAHVANLNLSHTQIDADGSGGQDSTRAGYDVLSRFTDYLANARGSVSQTEDGSEHTIEEGTVSRDFREHYFTLGSGLFDGSGYFDTGRKKMIGAYLVRDYRLDPNLKVNDRTSIDVILDRPATVEVEVQGQVLYRRRFESGNFVIEGLSIPQRFDTVTVRKVFLDGTEEEETRSFFRSSDVYPPGYYDFNLFAGLEYDSRESETGEPVVQIDNRFSVIDGLNLGGFARLADETASTGVGVYHTGPYGSGALETTFARDHDGNRSLSHRVRYEKYVEGLGIRAEAERLGDRDFEDQERDGSSLLRLTVDHALLEWNVLHSLTREIEDDGANSTVYGLSASRRIWRNGSLGLFFNHDTGSRETTATVRLTWAIDDFTAGVAYSDEGGNEVSVSARVGPGRAYMSRREDDDQISRQLRFNGDTSKGTVDVSASETTGDGSNRNVYSGFYAGAISLLDGDVFWHQPTTTGYAVATFNDDQASVESYDVLVDGSSYKRNVTGDSVYVGPLPNFVRNEITFLPNASGLFDTAKPVTMTVDNQRGTGVRVEVDVQRPANVSGRLLGPDGGPVPLHAGTLTAEDGGDPAYLFTDEQGRFLIEQVALAPFAGIVRGGGKPCRVELDLTWVAFPDPAVPLADIGDIRCLPIP